jgi:hypothetical protein
VVTLPLLRGYISICWFIGSLLCVMTPGAFGTSEVGVCSCLVCDFAEYGVFPDMDQNEKFTKFEGQYEFYGNNSF